MVNYCSIQARRTLWILWKGKKIWHQKRRLEGVQYTTEEEWRAITKSSRKNEVAGKSWNVTQLLMYLVVKIKSDTVKNNITSVQFSSVTQSCPTLCDPISYLPFIHSKFLSQTFFFNILYSKEIKIAKCSHPRNIQLPFQPLENKGFL